MRIEAGVVIGDRFRLLSPVGVGAFGSLWRAADRVPGKQAAISIMSDPALSSEALDDFTREMMRATAVRHRSLARIYAAGRDPSGVVWIASEFVDGETLESVLERRAPSAIQVLSMIAELAGALAELHALGLAHSAVSTRTVLMPRSRSDAMRPTLIGLGRARLLGAKQPAVTAHALPEAAFFSPEAFASQQFSAASDVWSLGVLLFRCVGGRLPFAARTAAAMQVETQRLSRPLAAIEDAGIRLLIAECFALDPARRPSASELARRALALASEVEEEEPTAIFSRPDPTTQSAEVPAEGSPPSDLSSLAPIELSAEPAAEEPAPEAAESESVTELPFRDVDNDVAVDFRPSRGRAKFIIAAAAAAVIFAELIIATREPRPAPPPVAAHVETVSTPEPAPPAVTPTPPAATAIEVPTVASTAPTASASAVATQKPSPKPAPAKPTPPPAIKAGDDNPYE